MNVKKVFSYTMYIKQFTAEGFLSFKKSSKINLRSGLNYIAGESGESGSDLLFALYFLISDTFRNLTNKERLSCINAVKDPEAPCASIEFVLGDTRGLQDVHLRIEFSQETIEYFSDGLRITEDDYTYRLIEAGFSKIMPCYAVQKADVTKYERMSDVGRLKALKDISGKRFLEKEISDVAKYLKDMGDKIIRVQETSNRCKEIFEGSLERVTRNSYDEQLQQWRDRSLIIAEEEYQKALDQLHNDYNSLPDNAKSSEEEITQGFYSNLSKKEEKIRSEITNETLKIERKFYAVEDDESYDKDVAKREAIMKRLLSLRMKIRQFKVCNPLPTENYGPLCSIKKQAKQQVEETLLTIDIPGLEGQLKAQEDSVVDSESSVAEITNSILECERKESDLLAQEDKLTLEIRLLKDGCYVASQLSEQAIRKDKVNSIQKEIKTKEEELSRVRARYEELNKEFTEAVKQQQRHAANQSLLVLEKEIIMQELDNAKESLNIIQETAIVTQSEECTKDYVLQELHSIESEMNKLKAGTTILQAEGTEPETVKEHAVYEHVISGRTRKDLQQERGKQKELIESFYKQAKKVKQLSQIIEKPHQYCSRLSRSSDPPEKLRLIQNATEQFRLYQERSRMLHKDRKNTLDLLDSSEKTMAQLQNLLQELDTEKEATEKCLSVLNRMMDNSIKCTFVKLRENFIKVFSVLVPDGIGGLALLDKDGVNENGTESRYTALQVKVVFPGDREQKYMKQLPKEKKEVVAMALLFSIMLVDRVPLYLLDQLERALNHQYQKNFGDMLEHFDDGSSQIIITTDKNSKIVKRPDFLYVIGPGSVEEFELAYPPGSLNPDLVMESDLACLKPTIYISDAIVNFYIRYLQVNQPQLVEKKIQIFTTFFYTKLQQLTDTEQSYIKLRRWWQKSISLFDTPYILFPIHESNHWSLGIICMPTHKGGFGPTLLHLDSFDCHRIMPIFDNVRKLFEKEWALRLKETSFEPKFSLDQLEYIVAEVPKQKNPYDCALFVMKYIEQFIIDVPPGPIHQSHMSMINKHWFDSKHATELREKILDLLENLFGAAKAKATKSSSVEPDKPKSSSVDPDKPKSSSVDPDKQLLMQKESQVHIRGLYNLGNTCYANSVIQCLMRVPPLVRYFVDDFVVGPNMEGDSEVAVAFKDLLVELCLDVETPIRPGTFMLALTRNCKQFIIGVQNDSQEFLLALLSCLDNHLNLIGDSMISRTFQGRSQESNTCLSCGNKGVPSSTAFKALPLPIPHSGHLVSLLSCVEEYIKEETLKGNNAWWCPNCGENQTAKRKTVISELPDILIIQLLRFKPGKNHGDDPVKVHTLVEFPIDDELDLTPHMRNEDSTSYRYQLFAVNNHYGAYGSGHYTAFAKCGESWYAFSDSEVEILAKDKIVNPGAYLLFYKRIKN